jgi:UDP-2-acetamido-2,6-beta-L-arabino-hexul-4-ose reductase
MKILLTGANGFIGRNLRVKIKESNINLYVLKKNLNLNNLKNKLLECDVVIHLAGVNRTKNKNDFDKVNFGYTKKIIDFFSKNKKKIHFVYASSTQVKLNNPYGLSKKKTEILLKNFAKNSNSTISIYRMPIIFGKWAKKNHNSFIATACSSIINDKHLNVFDETKPIKLIYIDDLIDHILKNLKVDYIKKQVNYLDLENITYTSNIKKILSKLKKFNNFKKTLKIENVGTKFNRVLYSTFISYYKKENFKEIISAKKDNRGSFLEIMKTRNTGQFSLITIKPNKIRGNHYHHTKTEKFLLIKGKVKFNFKNIDNKKRFSIIQTDKEYSLINTVPGWSHNIQNLSKSESILLIWVNEVFDFLKSDTIKSNI